MSSTNQRVETKAVHGLEILDLDENERICLPTTYARKELPVSCSDIITEEDLKGWPHLSDVPLCLIQAEVGLMIGANVPEAIKPLKVVSGPPTGPYASQHRLGWAINGPLSRKRVGDVIQCNRTKVDLEEINIKIRHMYDAEFQDSGLDSRGPSVDDTKWLKRVENSIRTDERGHYEIALPFRDTTPSFPNNRKQALQRLESIGKRMQRDQDYRKDYSAFMQTMLDSDFAEPVPLSELKPKIGQVWYIIHHAVYHKRKKTIRIVFNCSSKFMGISLNDTLLPGPDLVNNLLGVLIRFRERKIAIMADIEKMFYQVKVPEENYDFLRFLWYPDGDFTRTPHEYRLKVHVFGAVSSPSCASFALQQAARDHEDKVNRSTVKTIKDGFYVDDLVVSVDEVTKAITLLKEIRLVCSQARFNLTQISSNDREVLSSFDIKDLAQKFQPLDLHHEELPIERALGVTWNVETDTLGFKIHYQEKPHTRRGLLSTIYAIYDPFGHLGPIIMPAKRILQELCRRNCGWDEPLPSDLRDVWVKWTSELSLLLDYTIPRWIKISDDVKSVQVHVFCDGSEVGGQVRLMRSDNGTNFVGAEREIRETLETLVHEDIREEMVKMQVKWIFNPPYAHHFGGVWEREILDVFPGQDKMVRQVKVKSAGGTYKRPISHLVMLQENNELDQKTRRN
ncbi:uncharacterized protein LOC131886703 [Tigriopus californicus]|uniref:uncharacterized protein LOC131886703 n=1 Tax=Tigriopus californicus TaxID=6832 RepID=UPI0027D9F22D|nr:uncharacterized protein LOC131886703 [Tigriopus californicus]